ncbi:unnamed protein product [Peronospora belbahrii]|uniref:FYVE-type domain-containing protein n=1 Tax=Peronospora belbahrii TaxID=622444 RepID=A0ABN8CZM7_9STRA|nr:unnamed protein product [Peronospora belbahrii]
MARRQCKLSTTDISSRSIFKCSDDTKLRRPFGQVSGHLDPAMRSFVTSSSDTCRSAFDPASSMELKDENEALLALATSARANVEHAQRVFATARWKGRKESQGIRACERKTTPGVYEVTVSTSLPCTVNEIVDVFSSHNSDDFNATMVALAGDAFSYAVTLREVPTASVNTHLTIKRMQFSGSIPLLSSTKTIEFLDYLAFNNKTRTAVRIFQTLTCDRDGRLIVGGDVFGGYVLSEQISLHQTLVFYFGSHIVSSDELKAKGIVKANNKPATVRESATHTLLKLAKMIPKVGDIAIRRRLGVERTVDPANNVSERSCFGCGKLVKESLLRKKHICDLCGHHTCGSCSKSQDVEEQIGLIKRLRVCCMCVAAARHRIFGSIDQLDEGLVRLSRPSLDASALSTASSSCTASTLRSSRRTRMLHKMTQEMS